MVSNQLEDRRGEEDSENAELISALLEAEAQTRRYLEKVLGSKSDMGIVIRFESKRGEKTLIIDVMAEGVMDRETLLDVIDEVLKRAFSVFEEKTGMKPVEESKDKTVSRRL